MIRNACCVYVCLLLFSLGSCAQQKEIPFNDPRIAYEGRVAFTSESAVLMWCGTSIKINFIGSGIAGRFKDADTANYYNILIDGKLVDNIHFGTAIKTYPLAENLRRGKHSLEIFKRTEWDKGKTFFYGFEHDDRTTVLRAPAPAKRKIEFFGNSVTCGYAIEDYTGDSHTGFFENSYNAYAAITARHFNAAAHYTAKSGIGITISWFPLLMREMYDRLDPTDSLSKWDFSKFTPGLVVVNLLQNDSWLVNMPDHEQFKNRFGTQKPPEEFIIGEYKKFIQSVRGRYPDAKIICMLGNMDITKEGSVWPGYVTAATTQLGDKDIYTLFVPYKNTAGHPKTPEQRILADSLINFIEKNIQW